MVNSNDLEMLIQEYTSMGFDPQDIIMAWFNSNQRKSLVLDHLLTIAQKGLAQNVNTPPTPKDLTQSQVLEEQIQKAIKLSLEEREKYIKPNQLLRGQESPAGLNNVGNTCYFNSLIQTIFHIKGFLYNILTFRPPQDLEKVLAEMQVTDPVAIKRKKACVRLVLALRKLFVLMLFGNKNQVDTSEITSCLIDANGKIMKVGEQLDIGEFSINFFERIDEGLLLKAKTDDEVVDKTQVSFKDLFFGMSKDFITFEWADFNSKKELDAIFGPISLSITQKDLMSSLDSYLNFSVDGYQTPNGDITTAKKRIWITKAPKVLSFILQRPVYDKQKGLIKDSSAFDFPKELYIDRFLYENKKALKETLEEKKNMKNKLKRIDLEIARLKEYGSKKADLLAAMDITSEFLNERAEEVERDFVEVNSDASDDEKYGDTGKFEDLKKFCEMLKGYKEKIVKRIESLEKKKILIKNKVESSFQTFQKVKYRLHSVVVHEGGINGGHYYTLIHNKKKNKWMRFNDSRVEEISEQEAFKLARGSEMPGSPADKSNPKNPCAYCLFYVEEGCEVIDFSADCLESLKKLLSKDQLSFAESENTKFLTEYQHYNANLVKKINDEYLIKMNAINFEAAKFQNDFRNRMFPFVPSLPNFNSFLLLESPKCSEIARWNTLKSLITQRKVPYNVLEGEKRNYYFRELKELLVDKSSAYNLKSLELTDANKEILAIKKKEYVILMQGLTIIESIFELIKAKKYKETMAAVSLLHEKLNKLKMNDYSNQFFSFSSYLLAIMSLRFCALIDMYQAKSDTKEALKLLEIMLHCLNRKESIKPPEIFYQQIVSNLYYTVNFTGKKYMKEADMFIFMHLIQKIEERCEFLPSQDLSSLIPSELKTALLVLENDESLFRILESKNFTKLNDLYMTIFKERLRVWIDFETFIRKKNILVDQQSRTEKETPRWND